MVPITEQFKGQVVWSEIVEVFEIVDNKQVKICYAWGHHTDKQDQKSRYVTVLGIPPINSPLDAVRASIVSDSKNTL